MRINSLQALSNQVLKFIGVGGIATIFDYGVFFISITHLGIQPVQASLFGYIAGGFLSYGLSRRFVFQSHRKHQDAGLRFALVMLSGFFLTGICMALLVGSLLIHPNLARLVTYCIVLTFNFIAHRLFTFRQ